MRSYPCFHGFDRTEHIFVGEPDNEQTNAFKKIGPYAVFNLSFLMNSAVNFDNQPGSMTEKIRNVTTDLMLPPESQSEELLVP